MRQDTYRLVAATLSGAWEPTMGNVVEQSELFARITATFAYRFAKDNPHFNEHDWIDSACGSNGALQHMSKQVLSALHLND